MARRPLDDAEEVEVRSVADLRAWLAAHHGRESGVWLVTWRKGVPDRHVPYSDVVDQCLCFGWVDSLPRAKDDRRSMLWISPRKPGSNWSRVNRDKVARLAEAGQIAPPGQAAIDRAKSDGTWTALDGVEAGVIPADLRAALDAVPGAAEVWDAFPRSVTRGALEQLLNAKRPETRATRVAAILTAIEAGERPFQWRRGG